MSRSPLNAYEVSMTIGLLHRAALNGQSQLLMYGYRKYPKCVPHVGKALTVIEAMNQTANDESPSSSEYPSPGLQSGGMSEAAKRRLDLDETGESDWDKVSGFGNASNLRRNTRDQASDARFWRDPITSH